MRSLLAGAASALVLSGLAACASYRAPATNQFYLSLEYTPLVGPLAGDDVLKKIKHDDAVRRSKQRNAALDADLGCDDQGVLPWSPNRDDAPTPADAVVGAPSRLQGLIVHSGMLLDVAQVTARATGASETPVLTQWQWRVPRPADKGCPTAPLSRRDILVERGLVFGASWAAPNPAAGTTPNPTQLLWQGLVRAATPAGSVTEDSLRARLFDPIATRLYVDYRHADLGGAGYAPPAPATREQGLARAFLAICGLRLDDLALYAPPKADPLTDCADPAQWTIHNTAAPPSAVCGRVRKALRLNLAQQDNADVRLAIPKSNLALLSDGDDLFLTQPRPIDNMADGAYNLLNPPRDDAQIPVFGEAYAGFADFDVRIPVQVWGESQARWVSVCTTVSEFDRQTGLQVAALRRAAYWVDRQVSVLRDHNAAAEPVDQETFRDTGNRIRFHFDGNRWGLGSIGIDRPDDFLLAPGDILIPYRPRSGAP